MHGHWGEWELVAQPIAEQLRKAGWAVVVEHRLPSGGICDVLARRDGHGIVIEAKLNKATFAAVDQVLGYARELDDVRPCIASPIGLARGVYRVCQESGIDVWSRTAPDALLKRRINPPLSTDMMRSLEAWLYTSCDDASVKEAMYSFPELTVWQIREAFAWLAAWEYGEWGWFVETPKQWKKERFIPAITRSFCKTMSLEEMHERLDHRPLKDTVTHHDFSRRLVA